MYQVSDSIRLVFGYDNQDNIIYVIGVCAKDSSREKHLFIR
jgi:hypothetical protein